jgi:hypothetical protein
VSRYFDLISLDFLVVPLENSQFAMYAAIKGGQTVECYKGTFPPEDMAKLREDWKKLIPPEYEPFLIDF